MLLNLTRTRQTCQHQNSDKMIQQLFQSIVLWCLSSDKEVNADSESLPTALPQSWYHKGNFPAQPASPCFQPRVSKLALASHLKPHLRRPGNFTRYFLRLHSLSGRRTSPARCHRQCFLNVTKWHYIETLCGTCFCTWTSMSCLGWFEL